MSIISLYEKSDKLFFVGGFVRDELLGIKSHDIDLTYVGNAVEFAKTLDYEITQINEEFGSVHLKIGSKTFDITSTRTENYPQKGHLPVVDKIGCSLKEDVKRRDFTVNAIAKNCQSGEIVDYVGGREDLKNKKLRVLHDKSFIDDPTRIIRGLKFSVRFGFEPEEHTKNLQEDYLKHVNYDISFKRLKDELKDAFNINKQEVLDKFKEQKMYRLLSDKQY
ncbi:CCA tRNA nucleotidyltransferase, partial [bacterium]|nr:CCA tRNA nucleotidyltransferase [bacterium]